MNETDIPFNQAVHDADRVEYFRGSCEALLAAIIEDGVDIRSYFGWSESGPVILHNVELIVTCMFRPIG